MKGTHCKGVGELSSPLAEVSNFSNPEEGLDWDWLGSRVMRYSTLAVGEGWPRAGDSGPILGVFTLLIWPAKQPTSR